MNKTNLVAELGKQEVVISRLFSAPREQVFKYLTDPALVPQWWGPVALTTTIQSLDARMGGTWRFIQHDPGGHEYAFHGVYHEVTPPERLVYTFEYEGTPGHTLLEVVTLEEQGGQTLLTDKAVFQSIQDRDGMLQSGLKEGTIESMDRLAALIETS
jgi:uncharacterized protein YndB with AHSA1/START domain